MPSLVKRGPHFVPEHGMDYGGPENLQAIVVKWPRGKHWTANGAPYAYHPASTTVCTVEQKLDDAVTLQVEPVIQWDNTRRIKADE